MAHDVNKQLSRLWDFANYNDNVVILFDKNNYIRNRKKLSQDYLKNEYPKKEIVIISSIDEVIDSLKLFFETKYKNTDIKLVDFNEDFENELKEYKKTITPG